MLAFICNNKVSFRLPEQPDGKVTLKNWLDGVNTSRLSVAFKREGDAGYLAVLRPQWNGKQWQAAPVRFQVDNNVFTAWSNIQPDRFGHKNRIGYTVCIKYLYRRDTERGENPSPDLVAETVE